MSKVDPSFKVGDIVECISPKHGLVEYGQYKVTECEFDMDIDRWYIKVSPYKDTKEYENLNELFFARRFRLVAPEKPDYMSITRAIVGG